ncbi:hypothetical protein [Flammeovirga sp. SJP92]|uniref:hypothetical protein n=1 Tax=Flammeovirga sp. SJP92 TaxID=1775430 RepID=UPI000786BD45|nr:hypothetical protein [Flammeovirga sp. SJP92]KXX69341.1 hypothetical protein AVL50_19650 [Flammeovirga sp. SJP92]
MKNLIITSLLFLGTLFSLQAQTIETEAGSLHYVKERRAFVSNAVGTDIDKDNFDDIVYTYSYNHKRGIMKVHVVAKPEFELYAEAEASKAALPLIQEFDIDLKDCDRESYSYEARYEITVTLPVEKTKINIIEQNMAAAK